MIKTLNCQIPLDVVLEIKFKKSELRGCGINVLVKPSVLSMGSEVLQYLQNNHVFSS